MTPSLSRYFRPSALLIYTLGAILPVVFVGVAFNFRTMTQVMVHPAPQNRDLASYPIAHNQAPASRPPVIHRLRAEILVSNLGTEITDLLGPYEILSRAGFEVLTVAPERKLSPTTGNVSVLPDSSFKDAPSADLIVIPAVLDPDNADIQSWMRERAPQAKLLLAVCEGSRVLAGAGLLKGHKATSHFLALDALQATPSDIQWERGVRVVKDRDIITSAGVTASLDASLAAVTALQSEDLARQVAAELGYTWKKEAKQAHPENLHLDTTQEPGISLIDYLPVLVRGGFDWGKEQIGILLYPGVSELGLAAALDTHARSLSLAVTPVSGPVEKSELQPLVETEHGLKLFAKETLSSKSWFHVLMIPSGAPNAIPFTPLIGQWVMDMQPVVKDFSKRPSGQAFEDHLKTLSEMEGHGLATYVARMIEFGKIVPASQTPDYPSRIWIRVILLASVGISLVWMVRVRIRGIV